MVDGRVVASGRLTIGAHIADLPDPELYAGLPWNCACSVASINRLVVDPDFAGNGLSRLIDEARVAFADEMGVSLLLATTFAGPSRLAALEKLGFRHEGYADLYSSGPLSALENLEGGGRRQALLMRTVI
jgi:GNAT superfamily N-acetyltransferase